VIHIGDVTGIAYVVDPTQCGRRRSSPALLENGSTRRREGHFFFFSVSQKSSLSVPTVTAPRSDTHSSFAHDLTCYGARTKDRTPGVPVND
jgi:hypothetical protein